MKLPKDIPGKVLCFLVFMCDDTVCQSGIVQYKYVQCFQKGGGGGGTLGVLEPQNFVLEAWVQSLSPHGAGQKC